MRIQRYFFCLLIIFYLIKSVCSAENVAPKDLIKLSIQTPIELSCLLKIVTDLEESHSGLISIYADDAEQANLRAAGFDFHVEIENLSEYYAQRVAMDKQIRRRTATELGTSMGGFRTLAEIEQALDWLTATFPNIVSQKFSIGYSYEGREIWAVRISDNPNVYEVDEPTVWFDALHHAREPMSAESLLHFIYWLTTQYELDNDITRLVESRNIILLPCVNPDGYEYNHHLHPNGGGLWRKNRRDNDDNSYGVDLNRNYAWQWGGDINTPQSSAYQGLSAFSEPETIAIRDFLRQQTPTISVSVHSYGNEWMYPWGYSMQVTEDDVVFRHYAETIIADNGYTTGTAWNLYGSTYGASDDYHYAEHGSLAYTVEIGTEDDGFWPTPSRIPTLFETVRPGFQWMAQWAGAWGKWLPPTWQEQQGNGDPWFDAGEHWQLNLNLENQGVLPLNAQINLMSSHPELSITKKQTNLTVPPHQQGISDAIEVIFAPILDTKPTYTIDLTLRYEGVNSHETLKLHLGPQRTLIHDDMENADFVWQTNNLQQVELWQHAVPQQTVVDGQIAQTGKDNLKGFGCWVTGAIAGENVGSGDGIAWLTSPRFQADDLAHLQLIYSRWGASVDKQQDNQLQVKLSNDDGATWVILEKVKNTPRWETMSFDLEDYLPLNDRMRVRFRAKNGSNAKVCVDDFILITHSYIPMLMAWGQISAGKTLHLSVDGPASSPVEVFWSQQGGKAQEFPNIGGVVYLERDISSLVQGITDAKGKTQWLIQLPEYTALSGKNVYLQALFDYQTSRFIQITLE